MEIKQMKNGRRHKYERSKRPIGHSHPCRRRLVSCPPSNTRVARVFVIDHLTGKKFEPKLGKDLEYLHEFERSPETLVNYLIPNHSEFQELGFHDDYYKDNEDAIKMNVIYHEGFCQIRVKWQADDTLYSDSAKIIQREVEPCLIEWGWSDARRVLELILDYLTDIEKVQHKDKNMYYRFEIGDILIALYDFKTGDNESRGIGKYITKGTEMVIKKKDRATGSILVVVDNDEMEDLYPIRESDFYNIRKVRFELGDKVVAIDNFFSSDDPSICIKKGTEMIIKKKNPTFGSILVDNDQWELLHWISKSRFKNIRKLRTPFPDRIQVSGPMECVNFIYGVYHLAEEKYCNGRLYWRKSNPFLEGDDYYIYWNDARHAWWISDELHGRKCYSACTANIHVPTFGTFDPEVTVEAIDTKIRLELEVHMEQNVKEENKMREDVIDRENTCHPLRGRQKMRKRKEVRRNRRTKRSW